MTSTLFVCLGNICRSPLADAARIVAVTAHPVVPVRFDR